MCSTPKATKRRRGRPAKYERSWEERHVRVRVARDLYPSWIDLKRTGGFANDDDFVYHLLRSERDRQDRLDAE